MFSFIETHFWANISIELVLVLVVMFALLNEDKLIEFEERFIASAKEWIAILKFCIRKYKRKWACHGRLS